jgi:hypothetical protein
MKRLLTAAALIAASITNANAFYTQCTVQRDIAPANRPDGRTDTRWSNFEKGQKVALRDIHGDWYFCFQD